MFITRVHYIEVLNAVNRVLGNREGFPISKLEQVMTYDLKDAGKFFDGTIDSALHIFNLLGYEVEIPNRKAL